MYIIYIIIKNISEGVALKMAKKMRYKNIIDINNCMDYNCLEQNINKLTDKFKFAEKILLGKSYLGRNINLLKIGNGGHKVIYIGAHHGTEWITSMLLMRFAEDFCKSYMFNDKLYRYDPEYILQTRTIYIVPMINPDGVGLLLDKDNYLPLGAILTEESHYFYIQQ